MPGTGWTRRPRGSRPQFPKTPAGAIELLVALSRDYGGIETYAEGLLVLREDLRDPVLRARGAAWKAALSQALDACFADSANAPPGIGLLMASQWQGSLLWWGFDPQGKIEAFVEKEPAALRGCAAHSDFGSGWCARRPAVMSLPMTNAGRSCWLIKLGASRVPGGC